MSTSIRNPYASSSSNNLPPKERSDSAGLVVSESEYPLLSYLLPKMRPFQREALEFAVLGKKYERQLSSLDGNNNTSLISETRAAAIPSKAQPRRGRILLADEMGLGKTVCVHMVLLLFCCVSFSVLVVTHERFDLLTLLRTGKLHCHHDILRKRVAVVGGLPCQSALSVAL